MEGMKKSVDQVCMYVYIYMGYIYICIYVGARAGGINPKGLVVMYSHVCCRMLSVAMYIYVYRRARTGSV